MKAIKFILFVVAVWFTFSTVVRFLGGQEYATRFIMAMVFWAAVGALSKDADYREN